MQYPLPLLALLAVTVACGGEPAASAAVRDSAGVRIVENTGRDSLLDWSFARRFALGGDANGPASFTTVWPGQVAISSGGGIAILDRQAGRVVLFDSTGRFAGLVGRSGGGPGELLFPFGLAAAPDGEFWVTDVGKGAFVRFGPDHTPRTPVPFRRPGPQAMVALGRDTLALLERLEDRAESRQQYRIVLAAGADTAVLALGPALRGRTVLFRPCGVSYQALPVFVMLPVWAASGHRVVAALTPAYRADVYDGGVLDMSIRRATRRVPATPELAKRELGGGTTIGVGTKPCTIPASETIKQAGIAGVVPALKGSMAIAPDGAIWIQRHTFPDEPGLVDVFRPDGTYLGTLEHAPVPVAFLPSGDLVTIEGDRTGVQRVVVYRKTGSREKD